MAISKRSFSLKYLPMSIGLVVAQPAIGSGFPVVDLAAIAQMVAQLEQMQQQYEALVEQLDTAKEQLSTSKDELKALGRGVSGKAHLFTEQYTAKIPRNWRETLGGMEPDSDIGKLAQSIREENSQIDQSYFQKVDARTKDSLQGDMEASTNLEALLADTYDGSSVRFDRLESLRLEIEEATDMKTIADLQARIQVENAMLMNELIRLQSMTAMHEAGNRTRSQKKLQESFEQDAVSY